MNILGISCYYHDSAAALLIDGKFTAGADEERFSRIKHDNGFPKQAIDFCLKYAGIKTKDLDYVVFYEKPFVKFERILLQTLQTFPKSRHFFVSAAKEWLFGKLWIKNQLMQKLNLNQEKILFADHHYSHAASSFFVSPFEKAAILTLDGVGEWTTASLGKGKYNRLEIIKELKFPHSVGLLYSVFTAFLGFEVNSGEYKVMGMAPYGKPKYTDKIKQMVNIYKDGSIRLDMDYFTYHQHPERSFNEKFIKLFGKPREKESLFFTRETGFPGYFGKKPDDFEEKGKVQEYYADIATSLQAITEEIIFKMANYLHSLYKSDNLCMAGGVALNSVANGKILNKTPFKNLYIQPAAGDGGGALGAALYVYQQILGHQRIMVMTDALLGQDYTEAEIEAFLKRKKVKYQKITNDEKLMDIVVDYLVNQKVVGWFQGRFEWGPRALGNRSILADPRVAEMKDIVNSKIKFREPYRPFAPSMLTEHIEDYLKLKDAEKSLPARFMLLVVPVKKNKQKIIPAVTHVGGSSRLQAVDKKTNPRYYKLIEKFYKRTEVPVILNTSFNLRGEPIVSTPENAYNTFMKSGIDLLVLENYLIKKSKK